MTAPRAAGGLMTRPLTRPQLALSEAEGATLSRRERDLGWLRAPHPAFGHPLPEGEGSRRRVDPKTILLPSRAFSLWEKATLSRRERDLGGGVADIISSRSFSLREKVREARMRGVKPYRFNLTGH